MGDGERSPEPAVSHKPRRARFMRRGRNSSRDCRGVPPATPAVCKIHPRRATRAAFQAHGSRRQGSLTANGRVRRRCRSSGQRSGRPQEGPVAACLLGRFALACGVRTPFMRAGVEQVAGQAVENPWASGGWAVHGRARQTQHLVIDATTANIRGRRLAFANSSFDFHK